jgi:hypothetical protein
MCCVQKMEFYCVIPLAFLHIAHMSVLLFLLSVSSQCQQVGLPFMAWVTQHPPVHHPKKSRYGLSPRGQFLWSIFFFPHVPSFGYYYYFPSLLLFSSSPSWWIFFSHHTWSQVFFKKLLPTPPTYVQDQAATKPT